MAILSGPDKHKDLFNQPLSLKYAVFCIVDMVGLFPVIALPRAIINCGWLGVPLAFTVFLIEIYTAILLGHCWILGEMIEENIVEKRRRPYGALIELAFGRRLSTYAALILDISIFGASVPDLLIASQNLQVISWKFNNYEYEVSYCYWLLVVGVLIAPIMWFGSPKDMKLIGITSVSVVLLTSLLTWCSILTVVPDRIHVPPPSWESVGIAYGILAFQFDVHPMILSVQMDMRNKKEIGKAIILAFTVSGGLFVITMTLCYTLLGDRVNYNTLQSLPQSRVLDLALCLASLQVCLSMAVGSSPFFQDIEHSLGLPSNFGWRRVVFRSTLVMLGVMIAETVPRFDLLMGLVGGAFTGQLVFLFPPLLYRKLRFMLAELPQTKNHIKEYGTFPISDVSVLALYDPLLISDKIPERNRSTLRRVSKWIKLEDVGKKSELGLFEETFLVIVPLLGIGATAVATFFSFRETLEFAEITPSCIINASIATKLVEYSI